MLTIKKRNNETCKKNYTNELKIINVKEIIFFKRSLILLTKPYKIFESRLAKFGKTNLTLN